MKLAAQSAKFGDLLVAVHAITATGGRINRQDDSLIESGGIQFQVKRLQGLKSVADVELFARGRHQFRVPGDHLAHQHGMGMEIVALHETETSGAEGRLLRNCSTSDSEGWQPVPPSASVEIAPQAAPYRIEASTE